MEPTPNTDPVAKARRRMLEKAEQERIEREEAAELHRMAEEDRAKGKTKELTALLKSCSPDMAIRIRLEAAMMVMANPSMYGAQKQLQMDERALELARYAIEGRVA